MTAQPLAPEIAGRLHDVVLPGAVGLFPATPAWLVVLALLVAVLALLVRGLYRRRMKSRYRREAAAELREIASHLSDRGCRTELLEKLPVLVKRVALHLAPRDEVAALSGAPWLEFLDRTWHGSAFSSGPGRLLADLGYRTPAGLAEIAPGEVEDLLALLGKWLAGHHRPVTVSDSGVPGS